MVTSINEVQTEKTFSVPQAITLVKVPKNCHTSIRDLVDNELIPFSVVNGEARISLSEIKRLKNAYQNLK